MLVRSCVLRLVFVLSNPIASGGHSEAGSTGPKRFQYDPKMACYFLVEIGTNVFPKMASRKPQDGSKTACYFLVGIGTEGVFKIASRRPQYGSEMACYVLVEIGTKRIQYGPKTVQPESPGGPGVKEARAPPDGLQRAPPEGPKMASR